MHPLVSFHLLHSVSCESVLWYQKFSVPHTNCSCYKIDLIFLFLMSRMTLKTWFCMSHLYCSLFSPCRRSNIGGLLRERGCAISILAGFQDPTQDPQVTRPDPRADPAFSQRFHWISPVVRSHLGDPTSPCSPNSHGHGWRGSHSIPQSGTDEPFLFFFFSLTSHLFSLSINFVSTRCLKGRPGSVSPVDSQAQWPD